MLFHVRMDVRIPLDLDPDVRADLVGPREGLQPGAPAFGRVAAHLADRG